MKVDGTHYRAIWRDADTGDVMILDQRWLPHNFHVVSLKTLDDPLRDDPVASIDQTCVGCGNCGEVADAAVLCPSFYRADVVHNPAGFEKWWAGKRKAVIGWLQARRDARRLDVTEVA